MSVLVTSMFKGCAPPVELTDWPIWMPPPNYRGSPPPIEVNDDAEELARLEAERAAAEAEKAKNIPPPNKQRDKFIEVSGGKPVVDVNEAGRIARELGFAPSQADLAALHKEHGNDVSFEAYQKWMKDSCAPHKAADTPELLSSAFADIDRAGTGVITREQLATVLGNYGEALTAEEIAALLKTFNMNSDKVDYKAFIAKLLTDEEE